MNTILKKIISIVFLFSGMLCIKAQSENPVISAIQKEVDRGRAELKMESMSPPFFISYSVADVYTYSMTASLGSISNYANNHSRRGSLTRFLVGDYKRNNLNFAGGQGISQSETSLTDNSTGIPITIWRDLDRTYKTSVEQFRAKMATLQQMTLTEEEQALPDFEQVRPVNYVLQPIPVNFDKAYWENYLRKVSETAKQYPDILSSEINLYSYNSTIYTYNTEGSRYAVPSTLYRLIFTASVRSDDGQELSYFIDNQNSTFELMPDIAAFSSQCRTMMEELLKLRNAPLINEAYSGPVLFEGNSVGQIFRNTFFINRRLIASPRAIQRGQGQMGGNDFEFMLNKKVISRSITIKSITGQEFYKGQKLQGYYPVDAEGVAPDKELMLIEDGVLRNLLNGRIPTLKIQNSNGHARFQLPFAFMNVMPGNILITGNQTFTNAELRKKLLEVAKEEDLEYAYIVRSFSSNFHISKIYVADGREELVRGATISGITDLRNFKRILGTSDKELIYNYDNAKTTIIHPDALLFEDMDITRQSNIEFKKPFVVSKPR